MPRAVEQWIREAHFEGNPNAYFVLTCGVGCGNAAAYAQKLCTEKGLRFCGLAPVVMPENYLAMFATPSEGECQGHSGKGRAGDSDSRPENPAGGKFPRCSRFGKG